MTNATGTVPRINPYEPPRSPIGGAPDPPGPTRLGVGAFLQAGLVGLAAALGVAPLIGYGLVVTQLTPRWPLPSILDLASPGAGLAAGWRSLRRARRRVLAYHATAER